MQVARETLPSSIKYALKDIESDIARYRAKRKLLLSPEFNALFNAVNAIIPANCGTYTPKQFYASLSTKGFTWCDAPELFNTIEALTELFSFPECLDNPDNSYRTFTFKKGDYELSLICLLSDDAICQRVQTGQREVERSVTTKIVEPTYQFVC